MEGLVKAPSKDELRYVYCLFCQTGRCNIISELLRIRGIDQAFSPKIVCHERKQGVLYQVTRDLLPGYVFVYDREDLMNTDLLWGIEGVIRRVGRLENRFQLEGSDLAFARYLLAKEGVLGIVQLVQEGDQVLTDDPLFEGQLGRVLRLDARKKRAKIQYDFDGETRSTWIGCNLLYRSGEPVLTERETVQKFMKSELSMGIHLFPEKQ